MREVTHVKAHDRRLPQKSPEYIARNLALMTRKEDEEAFLRRHGVKTVGTDDPRLCVPIPAPANGSAPSKGGIIANLKALAGWK